MTDVMAVLRVGDEDARAVCVGCTELLAELGLLERIGESFTLDQATVGIYRLAEGVTVEECRQAVRKRHIGPPEWGARA